MTLGFHELLVLTLLVCSDHHFQWAKLF